MKFDFRFFISKFAMEAFDNAKNGFDKSNSQKRNLTSKQHVNY